MTRIKKNLTTALLVAVVLFWLSQTINTWLVLPGFKGAGIKIWLLSISLQSIPNTGLVFSIPAPLVLIYLLALAALGLLTFVYLKYFLVASSAFSWAFGFILGGAVSNIYSRLLHGQVLDFLEIEIFGLRGVWNAADLFIIAGIVIWIYGMRKRRVSQSSV